MLVGSVGKEASVEASTIGWDFGGESKITVDKEKLDWVLKHDW